jgi:acyl-coenzyme A synthetase/AMP-(fatty) acid ligase
VEAAVVGIEDPKWGEAACACVVTREKMSEQAVLELFQGRLAKFKHPRRVLFIEALPRNAMGKVQKFELKQRLKEAV